VGAPWEAAAMIAPSGATPSVAPSICTSLLPRAEQDGEQHQERAD
jgi:hypothetical protein